MWLGFLWGLFLWGFKGKFIVECGGNIKGVVFRNPVVPILNQKTLKDKLKHSALITFRGFTNKLYN